MNIEFSDRRFELVRSLGEGAAGEVFEAYVKKSCVYAHIGDHVAIKAYKPKTITHPNQDVRIQRELESSTTLKSQHVVRCYEVIKDKKGIFLVMELLEGKTLTQWMRENPLPSFNDIAQISQDLIEGICDLHKAGLIHRDVKPDNIMLTPRGVVLMDLGVVKALKSTLTITNNEFLGTIRYSAPEYLFGETYDHRVDVYGFGAILQELLFRRPVIDGESAARQHPIPVEASTPIRRMAAP